MITPGRAQLTEAQQEWLRVNAYLRANRHQLAVRAAGEYPAEARLAGTPLLAAPSWRPAAPVPLQDIRLEFRPKPPVPAATANAAPTANAAIAANAANAVARLAPCLLPGRPDGTRYGRFCDVIGDLAAPAVFQNRPVYRPVEAELSGDNPHLTFTRGRFFDGVDIGGAVAHEYAAAQLAAARGQSRETLLRAAVADPCDLTVRTSAMAISVLSLRHDRATGRASFPLHYRDPARVSHAGGMVQVIPVGIFQPSGEAPWNEANDFDLWRGMLREYAEELLGVDEDHGSETAPIDYDRWPFAQRMAAARGDGLIRAFCLGLGADPLTFAVDLLVVVVIDALVYDDLFGGAVAGNAEGSVLAPRAFDPETVADLTAHHPVQAAGEALLKLAVTHRDALLSDLRACRSRVCSTPEAYAQSRTRSQPGGGRPVACTPVKAIAARALLAAVLVLLALSPVTRAPAQGARQHAALAAALLFGAQLLLGYWFYSYLTWCYPLLVIAMIHARPEQEASGELAPDPASTAVPVGARS